MDFKTSNITSLGGIEFFKSLNNLYCRGTFLWVDAIDAYVPQGKLTSLDLSRNTALMTLDCYSNPYLTEIWLKTGQTIQLIDYDTGIATIKYK